MGPCGAFSALKVFAPKASIGNTSPVGAFGVKRYHRHSKQSHDPFGALTHDPFGARIRDPIIILRVVEIEKMTLISEIY